MARGDRFRTAVREDMADGAADEAAFLKNSKLMGADVDDDLQGDASKPQRRGRKPSGEVKFSKTVYLTAEDIQLVESHVGWGKEYKNFSEAISDIIRRSLGYPD